VTTMPPVVQMAAPALGVSGSSAWAVAASDNGSHAAGTCRPCAFFLQGLCSHGQACSYCHEPHGPAAMRRFRPPKHIRRRLREALPALDDPADAMHAALPAPHAADRVKQLWRI